MNWLVSALILSLSALLTLDDPRPAFIAPHSSRHRRNVRGRRRPGAESVASAWAP